MIPRTIHQIWLGGPPPAALEAFMASWKEQNPSWDYVLWDDNNPYPTRFPRLIDLAPTHAMKADILRYEILTEHGGLYVDSDFECHRSIDRITDAFSLVLASEYGTVTNSFLGMTPGHCLGQRLLERLGEITDTEVLRVPPNVLTGPHLLDGLVSTGDHLNDPETQLLASDWLFYPLNQDPDLVANGASKRFATHHALASWKSKTWLDTIRKLHLKRRAKRFLDLGHY